MILSNVNIGTGPSAGDGDPLRTAFTIINNNFQTITNNVNSLTNSVNTVAGRTGNVILTVNDIVGLTTNYAVNGNVTAANLGMRGYVDATVTANIALLVNAAPSTLDTIRELADAIGDDPNFAVNIALSVSTANTQMRGYVDGQITAANTASATANVGMTGYVNQANTTMKSYVDGQITAANAGVTSANLGLKGYVDQANTIQSAQVGAANLAIIAANLGMKGYVDSVASQSLYGNSNVKSYLTGGFDGNILPSANITYSLGDSTHQWRDLWVSNNTIYINSVPLSIDVGGNLLINGNTVAGSQYANVSVKTYLENYDGGVNGTVGLTLSGATYDVEIQANTAGTTKTWGFYTDGRLNMPGDLQMRANGRIIQELNEHLQIRVSDDEADGWALESIVDDGNGVDLTKTSVEYNKFRIITDLPGGNHQWTFQDNGQAYFPGAINGPTGSNFAIRIGGQLYAAPSYIDIETRSPVGDAIISQIRVGDPNVTIGTASTAYKWTFTEDNKFVIPQHSVITTANASGGLGGNTISIIGGASDADTWNGNPGGNVDIQGGYGSFADGYGGNGGDVNIRGGGSAEAQKGRVVISSGTNNWVFANTGTVTVPGEGVIQSLDDSVTLVSLNTTSGYANSVYLGTSGGLGFFDQSAGGNWLEIFRTGTAPDIKATTSNLLITTVIPGISSNTWTFGQNGSITFPDNTVQTTAWTGSGGYSNVQVATYLPTYTGNISAGNITVSNVGGYKLGTGAAKISTDDNTSILLTPDTGANALAGVKIGGSGYLLGPNGARNITLNYGSTSGAVGLQANVTVGSAGSGNLFVLGNVIARDITGGNISATGTSGKLGYNSGGFVQQATSNATQVTSNTTSGNIQLMSIDLGAHAVHTVAFSCNKLTTDDIILLQHINGGITSVYVDAYVASAGLAIIWLRDITGSGTGAFTPMLKYSIIKAPSA